MKTRSPAACVGVVVDDDRRAAERRSRARAAPGASSRRLPSRNAAAIPASVRRSPVNTTRRPSTNESAAASSHSRGGRRERRSAGAPSSGRTTQRDRRRGEPARRRRRVPGRRANATSSAPSSAASDDQQRRGRACARAIRAGSRAERTPAPGAPASYPGRRRGSSAGPSRIAAFRRCARAAARRSVVGMDIEDRISTPAALHPRRGSSPSCRSPSRSPASRYIRFAHRDRPGLGARRRARRAARRSKPCTYATERGATPADCGTLVVPENRADPRLAADRAAGDAHPRALARIRPSRSSASRAGPACTNMEFPKASRFADDHDVVLVGYRGVDGSSRLDCPEVVVGAASTPRDLLGASVAARVRRRAFRACADRLQADGVDLAGYTLPQRVDDLEAARTRARLRPRRPAQRERRHAHRADLRLAPPAAASTAR